MPTNPLYSVCLPTVLIADDNVETVALLRLSLSRAGMRVLSAQSGPQCLDLALRTPVDILLLDIVIPGMSGIKTCAALRTIHHTTASRFVFHCKRRLGDSRGWNATRVYELLTKPIRRRNSWVSLSDRRPCGRNNDLTQSP